MRTCRTVGPHGSGPPGSAAPSHHRPGGRFLACACVSICMTYSFAAAPPSGARHRATSGSICCRSSYPRSLTQPCVFTTSGSVRARAPGADAMSTYRTSSCATHAM